MESLTQEGPKINYGEKMEKEKKKGERAVRIVVVVVASWW